MTSNTKNLLAAAQRMQSENRPFALVSVVRVQAPTATRAGDKALVTADGQFEGWIGGGCAQPAVLRTVREALSDGQARLIRIAPAAQSTERDLGDILEFGMACHSGGTIELFIDPVLPMPQLVVMGDSPVAVAITGLAPRVGFNVVVVAHDGIPERFADADQVITDDDSAVVTEKVRAGAFVLVATQGRRDIQSLSTALNMHASRIFFVASARKAQVLKESLTQSGFNAQAVADIVAPAGEATGAQTPEEIALAALTALVASRRAAMPNHNQSAMTESDSASGTDTAQTNNASTDTQSESTNAVVTATGSCCGGAVASPKVS